MRLNLLALILVVGLLAGCHEPVADIPCRAADLGRPVDPASAKAPEPIRWPELYKKYFGPKCSRCHKEYTTEISGYGAMFGRINLLQPHEPSYPPYDPPIFWDPLVVRLPNGKVDPTSPLIDPRNTYLFIMSEPGGGFSGSEPNMPFDEYQKSEEFPSAKLADETMKTLILRWTSDGALY